MYLNTIGLSAIWNNDRLYIINMENASFQMYL